MKGTGTVNVQGDASGRSKLIVQTLQNIRLSLAKIPNNFTEFKFKHGTREDIVRIINELHDKTSTGIDNIPPKLIKIASEIISDPLTELINQALIRDLKFPCLEKIAGVTPVFKKEDRMEKSNYRPISVLNVFSKVFERFLLNQMIPYLDNVLSTYLSAYRKGYSCQHVLLRLLEKWRQCLKQSKVVGAILDLSKAFDALPHDLFWLSAGNFFRGEGGKIYCYANFYCYSIIFGLTFKEGQKFSMGANCLRGRPLWEKASIIAKLNAYGFSKQALKIILAYLSGRRQ